MLEYIIFENLP